MAPPIAGIPPLSARAPINSAQKTHATETAETQQTAVVRATGQGVSNQQRLAQMLTPMHDHLINGDNRDEIEAHIDDLAKTLDKMGETPASLDNVLAGLSQRSMGSSALKGAKDMAASVLLDVGLENIPMPARLSSLLSQGGGLVSGLSAHLPGAFNKALDNTDPLNVSRDKLVPVMAKAWDGVQPGQAEKLAGKAAGLAMGSDTVKNYALDTAVAFGTAASGGKIPASVIRGAMVAGGSALTSGFNHVRSRQAHRNGPEFFFGRKDWKNEYVKMRDQSMAQSVLSGGARRLAAMPKNVASAALNAEVNKSPVPAMVKDAIDGNGPVRTLRGVVAHTLQSETFKSSAHGSLDAALQSESAEQLFTRFPAARSLGPAALRMALDHFMPLDEAGQPPAENNSAQSASATPSQTLTQPTPTQPARPTSRASFQADQLQQRLNAQAG